MSGVILRPLGRQLFSMRAGQFSVGAGPTPAAIIVHSATVPLAQEIPPALLCRWQKANVGEEKATDVSCPGGKYQDNTARDECFACPQGKHIPSSTSAGNHDELDDCLDVQLDNIAQAPAVTALSAQRHGFRPLLHKGHVLNALLNSLLLSVGLQIAPPALLAHSQSKEDACTDCPGGYYQTALKNRAVRNVHRMESEFRQSVNCTGCIGGQFSVCML